MTYFSERGLSHKPRTHEELSPSAWAAIVKIITTRMADGFVGHEFPKQCEHCIAAAINRELIYLRWPVNEYPQPSLYDALDLVQFCYERVSYPFEPSAVWV